METKFEIACYDNKEMLVDTLVYSNMRLLFKDLDMLIAMREHSKFEISKIEVDEDSEGINSIILAEITVYPENFL